MGVSLLMRSQGLGRLTGADRLRRGEPGVLADHLSGRALEGGVALAQGWAGRIGIAEGELKSELYNKRSC